MARWLAIVLACAGFLITAGRSSALGPLIGLPPLVDLLDEGRIEDDGLEFHAVRGRWETVEVSPLEPMARVRRPFDELLWFVDEDGLRGRAEETAEDWLGLEELDLGTRRLRASKDLGSRLRVTTFTGYQSSSQRMIRAEYELGRGLLLLSEARERGESRAVVLREHTFP